MNLKFNISTYRGRSILIEYIWKKGNVSTITYSTNFIKFKSKFRNAAEEIEKNINVIISILSKINENKISVEVAEIDLLKCIDDLKKYTSVDIKCSDFRLIQTTACNPSFKIAVLDHNGNSVAKIVYDNLKCTTHYYKEYSNFVDKYPSTAELLRIRLECVKDIFNKTILTDDCIDFICGEICLIEKESCFKVTYDPDYYRGGIYFILNLIKKEKENHLELHGEETYNTEFSSYELEDVRDEKEVWVKDDVIKPKQDENSSNKRTDLTFKDVIGMDEVKDKLNDVILQVKNADRYQAWNIKPIKGILLYGPSGTGKSYISEAFANEIDAKFFPLSTADLMNKYLGESAKSIRTKFEEARKHNLSILYIDEIDAIASKRDNYETNKEKNATLNELLVQMSSPENDNIIMVFATNMIDLLDPAFLRSGRCDFKIEVPLPDFECRKGILELNSKGRPISDDVDFEKIARNMSGMNCADVSHVANEAARIALKQDKEVIEAIDFDKAFEEMLCGSKSKTKRLNEKEKEVVAIHETGHLLANEIYKVNKTKKISILPRGNTLGFVLHANEDENDKFLNSKEELLNQIRVCLAGRAAEEIFFGDVTTGASNDIEKANNIATDMVTKYGFVKELGLTTYNMNNPMSLEIVKPYIEEILADCYSDVVNMLNVNKHIVEHFSNILKDKEELNANEIKEALCLSSTNLN